MLSNKEKIDYSKSVVSVGAIPTFIISTKKQIGDKDEQKKLPKEMQSALQKSA